MSRGGSYGGGKSSLSYLFEPDETTQTATNSTAKRAPKTPAKEHEKTNEANRTDAPDKPQVRLIAKAGQTSKNSKTKVVQDGKPEKHISHSNIAECKHQGQNAAYFPNGRPSTKVNSVPGGPSSLGYLFGDS
ncbi:spiral1 [Rhynchospora pubera]|uniref:Spiral1 n=1 Tax=Rhynchospora pubera TaxID=906938 RepID=A0AAV8H7E5_9POAL|nr:spiral1 [Rhynchospora pubera]